MSLPFTKTLPLSAILLGANVKAWPSAGFLALYSLLAYPAVFKKPSTMNNGTAAETILTPQTLYDIVTVFVSSVTHSLTADEDTETL